MNEAVVIPTGNEIRNGIVQDSDSPAVICSLIRMEPLCVVHRDAPVNDDRDAIQRAIEYWADKAEVDLIVLIGGSGGGRRHSSTLSEDYTHNALEDSLDEKVSHEIWGKNGHLWCKLICGKKNGSLVINLPGPYVEAKAAIDAFCRMYPKCPDNLAEINDSMVRAVLDQYPGHATE